jgi:hypothetical protein
MHIIVAIIIVLALCVVILVMTAALALALVGGLMTGVPFIASPRATTDALTRLCPLDATSVFYDLGCGDGRFVAAMAKRYPTARCIGVEKAPLPALLMWMRLRLSPMKNIEAQYRDVGSVNLANATHVYLYLFPFVMERLLPKFIQELRPSTRVVSCDFVFKDRTPDQIVPLGTGAHTLYVYDF